MRTAILESDRGLLSIYNDVLCDFSPDLFDSPEAFKKVFSNQYDVLVIAHRFDRKSWDDILRVLKPRAKIIVTSTFKTEDYRSEPIVYHSLTDQVRKLGAELVEKDDYEALYHKIELTFLREQAFDSLKTSPVDTLKSQNPKN